MMMKPTADEREEIEYIAYRKEKTVADVEEEARKIIRYDRAVELLRECVTWSRKSDCPRLDWIDLQVDRKSYAEAMAFLAEEPK